MWRRLLQSHRLMLRPTQVAPWTEARCGRSEARATCEHLSDPVSDNRAEFHPHYVGRRMNQSFSTSRALCMSRALSHGTSRATL
eukprot:7388305-Prymnesium_polylepis.1